MRLVLCLQTCDALVAFTSVVHWLFHACLDSKALTQTLRISIFNNIHQSLLGIYCIIIVSTRLSDLHRRRSTNWFSHFTISSRPFFAHLKYPLNIWRTAFWFIESWGPPVVIVQILSQLECASSSLFPLIKLCFIKCRWINFILKWHLRLFPPVQFVIWRRRNVITELTLVGQATLRDFLLSFFKLVISNRLLFLFVACAWRLHRLRNNRWTLSFFGDDVPGIYFVWVLKRFFPALKHVVLQTFEFFRRTTRFHGIINLLMMWLLPHLRKSKTFRDGVCRLLFHVGHLWNFLQLGQAYRFWMMWIGVVWAFHRKLIFLDF